MCLIRYQYILQVCSVLIRRKKLPILFLKFNCEKIFTTYIRWYQDYVVFYYIDYTKNVYANKIYLNFIFDIFSINSNIFSIGWFQNAPVFRLLQLFFYVNHLKPKQMKRNKSRHARTVLKYVISRFVFIGWVCYALNVYMQRSVPYWSCRQHIGLF